MKLADLFEAKKMQPAWASSSREDRDARRNALIHYLRSLHYDDLYVKRALSGKRCPAVDSPIITIMSYDADDADSYSVAHIRNILKLAKEADIVITHDDVIKQVLISYKDWIRDETLNLREFRNRYERLKKAMGADFPTQQLSALDKSLYPKADPKIELEKMQKMHAALGDKIAAHKEKHGL
jgi:hypothetical protein